MTSYLRPDEMASESEMRKAKNRSNEITSGFETAASFGTPIVGAKIASKILPFLSEYIPEKLALKGIEKVSPKIGNFLKSGAGQGLTLTSGLDYLKKQFSPSEHAENENAKEDRNPIQKYSPELYEFLNGKIQEGLQPIQAGAMAQLDKKFAPIIKKLSEDYKTPFSNLLETIFGKSMGGKSKENNQMPNQNLQSTGAGQNDKWGQISQALQNMLNS